jgi:hypothetical protein
MIEVYNDGKARSNNQPLIAKDRLHTLCAARRPLQRSHKSGHANPGESVSDSQVEGRYSFGRNVGKHHIVVRRPIIQCGQHSALIINCGRQPFTIWLDQRAPSIHSSGPASRDFLSTHYIISAWDIPREAPVQMDYRPLVCRQSGLQNLQGVRLRHQGGQDS